MTHRRPSLIILTMALTGCQATPHTLDGSADYQAAALSPDATVVALTGGSDDSWESLQDKLRKLCREQYPTLGTNPVVKVLGQREVEQVAEIAFPAGLSGAAGADTRRFALAPSPTLMRRVKAKKMLALCQAPAQP